MDTVREDRVVPNIPSESIDGATDAKPQPRVHWDPSSTHLGLPPGIQSREQDTYSSKNLPNSTSDMKSSIVADAAQPFDSELIALEQQKRLFKCCRGDPGFDGIWYKFKRFETLSLLNLYHCQQELANLEKTIMTGRELDGVNYPPGCMNKRERQLLDQLLHAYHESILRFKEISQIKRPSMAERKKVAKTLSTQLDDECYETAIDALGMLDLSPQSLGIEADSIRLLVAKSFHHDERAHTYAPGSKPRGKTHILPFFARNKPDHGKYIERILGVPERPYTMHISRTADLFARVLVSLIAGAFLLAPMVVLTFVTNFRYRLVATCLFVLAFTVTVSLLSRASNQELMIATATYSAVLVVFIGQTTDIKS